MDNKLKIKSSLLTSLKKLNALIAIITLLTAASGNAYCQAVMTMTTAPKTKEVSFILEGSGKVTIDWGDGKKENSIISNAYSGCSRIIYRYEHTYSDTSAHTITIIGENIEKLHCADNQLTKLDVSKNTALKRLYCYDNQLTDLDVSKNTLLNDLHCFKNNLTRLNVSGCLDLGYLSCRDNLLTNLDVSKNLALRYLDCKRNKLTSLDVTNCTNLKDLVCQSNRLTSLDVSKNTLLEDLHCYDNQLTKLDISKNTELEVLDCAGNQLTNLDVSENKKLYRLNCDENNFSAKALNALFVSLHNKNVRYNRAKYVCIYGNSGINACDKSIAEKKGWEVIFREGKNHTNG